MAAPKRGYGVNQATRFVVLAGALALAACASQRPTTTSTPNAAPANVGATAFAAPRQDGGFKPPADYRRVMVDGQEKFCRKFFPTGSRVESQTECLTENQLKARLEADRVSLEDAMRSRGGTSANQTGPGMGH
jgi:hypothetical protein